MMNLSKLAPGIVARWLQVNEAELAQQWRIPRLHIVLGRIILEAFQEREIGWSDFFRWEDVVSVHDIAFGFNSMVPEQWLKPRKTITDPLELSDVFFDQFVVPWMNRPKVGDLITKHKLADPARVLNQYGVQPLDRLVSVDGSHAVVITLIGERFVYGYWQKKGDEKPDLLLHEERLNLTDHDWQIYR